MGGAQLSLEEGSQLVPEDGVQLSPEGAAQLSPEETGLEAGFNAVDRNHDGVVTRTGLEASSAQFSSEEGAHLSPEEGAQLNPEEGVQLSPEEGAQLSLEEDTQLCPLPFLPHVESSELKLPADLQHPEPQ